MSTPCSVIPSPAELCPGGSGRRGEADAFPALGCSSGWRNKGTFPTFFPCPSPQAGSDSVRNSRKRTFAPSAVTAPARPGPAAFVLLLPQIQPGSSDPEAVPGPGSGQCPGAAGQGQQRLPRAPSRGLGTVPGTFCWHCPAPGCSRGYPWDNEEPVAGKELQPGLAHGQDPSLPQARPSWVCSSSSGQNIPAGTALPQPGGCRCPRWLWGDKTRWECAGLCWELPWDSGIPLGFAV